MEGGGEGLLITTNIIFLDQHMGPSNMEVMQDCS